MQFYEYLRICLLFNYVASTSCWQYFVSLGDLTMVNSMPDKQHSHSQYMYGFCKEKGSRKLYQHVHLDHLSILGKVIVRMCVPRITYCHEKKRYKYFYYEWYLPLDFIGGMDWDIYFSGPPELEWG